MKNFIRRYYKVIAALALVITTFSVNTTCSYTLHQAEIPEQAKKLRKF